MPNATNAVKSQNVFHPTALRQRESDDGDDSEENVGGGNGENNGDGTETTEDMARLARKEEAQTLKGKEKAPDDELSSDETIDPVLRTAKPKSLTAPPKPPLSKRKYSALMQSTSASPTTVSSTPGPSAKRRHISSASGPDTELSGLNVQLNEFTEAFRSATGTSVTAGLESSPMRRRRAIRTAQDLEDDLSDEHLAALVNIFIADVNAADAYMELKRVGLRKAWVADRLKNVYT